MAMRAAAAAAAALFAGAVDASPLESGADGMLESSLDECGLDGDMADDQAHLYGPAAADATSGQQQQQQPHHEHRCDFYEAAPHHQMGALNGPASQPAAWD